MPELPDWLPIPRLLDLVDIAGVAIFVWLAIRYFRRTRAQTALAGLGLLAVVYFVARSLDLRVMATLFQGFFAVVVLVLVVVFQDDLRRAFEQLGSWRRRNEQVPTKDDGLDALVRAVTQLARQRTGALIVLPGREPLERHLEGGIVLGGRVSEPLLLSLFDTSSPGHDGAVLLRGSKIERFALHLPLSVNHSERGPGGTRHAAALGLSERCDATCIVVSEERGTVSLVRGGVLRALESPDVLAAELHALLAGETSERPWWRERVGLDAAMAAAAALALWIVLVPGSDLTDITLDVPIDVMNLPEELALTSIEPETVEVTLRGLRRDLLLAERGVVDLRLDAYLARFGRRTFSVSESDVQTPDSITVVSISPEKVRISLDNAATKPGRSGS